MCEVSTYTDLQVLQHDPTRTLTIRNAFVRAMNKRFNALIKVIKEAIVDQDGFGLELQTNAAVSSPGYQAFNYPRPHQKIDAFMKWLKIQEEKGLLEIGYSERIGESIEGAWTNMYLEDSYKRGVIRARTEMKKAGYTVPTVEASGGISAIMGAGFHVDRIGLIFTRAFNQLQGITNQMDAQISQILAQGMADGDGPRMLARKIIAVIDGSGSGELGITDSLGRYIPAKRRAQTLARTEMIRAHHAANMQEYKNWRVLGVDIIAEFITAGDERVCTECASYHGNRYTLEAAEHMIPVHPNCRCVAIPVDRKTVKGPVETEFIREI